MQSVSRMCRRQKGGSEEEEKRKRKRTKAQEEHLKDTGGPQDKEKSKAHTSRLGTGQTQSNGQSHTAPYDDVTVREGQLSGGRGCVQDSCFLPWYIIASAIVPSKSSRKRPLGGTVGSRQRGRRVGFCDPFAEAGDGRNGDGYRKRSTEAKVRVAVAKGKGLLSTSPFEPIERGN